MNNKHFWQVPGMSSLILVVIAVACGAQQQDRGADKAGHDHGTVHTDHRQSGRGGLSIPQPLTIEHQELHEQLLRGTKEAGDVGRAARTVAERLHPHIVKEEQYALPLLGLLSPVSQGKAVPEAEEAIAMAGKLKADLPHMLEEHRQIVASLDTLKKAASRAGKAEYVHFAEKLRVHAQTEEQVLYPAAILVGEYLKLSVSK